MMFEKHKSLDILRQMNDLKARYSENDFQSQTMIEPATL